MVSLRRAEDFFRCPRTGFGARDASAQFSHVLRPEIGGEGVKPAGDSNGEKGSRGEGGKAFSAKGDYDWVRQPLIHLWREVFGEVMKGRLH